MAVRLAHPGSPRAPCGSPACRPTPWPLFCDTRAARFSDRSSWLSGDEEIQDTSHIHAGLTRPFLKMFANPSHFIVYSSAHASSALATSLKRPDHSCPLPRLFDQDSFPTTSHRRAWIVPFSEGWLAFLSIHLSALRAIMVPDHPFPVGFPAYQPTDDLDGFKAPSKSCANPDPNRSLMNFDRLESSPQPSTSCVQLRTARLERPFQTDVLITDFVRFIPENCAGHVAFL